MKIVPIISGIGLVTVMGKSVGETWQSLLAGRSIVDHTRLEMQEKFGNPRIAAIGIQAADEAVAQANWTRDRQDTAVICCTSKGTVEDWINGNHSASDSFGLAELSTAIARHTGFTTGARLTLSAACAGGLHGLIRAAMMIQNGEATRVLVVAAEASVHPLFIGSFRRLGVLPPQGELCRPFDINRRGFLMSDAAAAVCVQAAHADDLPPHFVQVDQYAMGGDATHLTASDPDGQVLRHLLRRGIGDEPVQLVHAHGTGTVANDGVELAAIESVLSGRSMIPLFSHKGALGHSLGASGLVAVVINCMCHRTGMVPPNVNTTRPIQSDVVRVTHDVEKTTIHRSIVHAAGFGGPTAVVGLRSDSPLTA